MKRLLGVTILGLAGAFAGQAQAACSAADKAELEALDRAWSEAGRKGDKAAIAEEIGRLVGRDPAAVAGDDHHALGRQARLGPVHARLGEGPRGIGGGHQRGGDGDGQAAAGTGRLGQPAAPRASLTERSPAPRLVWAVGSSGKGHSHAAALELLLAGLKARV